MHPQKAEAHEIRELQDEKKLISRSVFKESTKVLNEIKNLDEKEKVKKVS